MSDREGLQCFGAWGLELAFHLLIGETIQTATCILNEVGNINADPGWTGSNQVRVEMHHMLALSGKLAVRRPKATHLNECFSPELS